MVNALHKDDLVKVVVLLFPVIDLLEIFRIFFFFLNI